MLKLWRDRGCQSLAHMLHVALQLRIALQLHFLFDLTRGLATQLDVIVGLKLVAVKLDWCWCCRLCQRCRGRDRDRHGDN
jgi:hypothetical protein